MIVFHSFCLSWSKKKAKNYVLHWIDRGDDSLIRLQEIRKSSRDNKTE